MVVTCFVLCGATCEEASRYELEWADAAVQAGIADKTVVMVPPLDALGPDWSDWWLRYNPKSGERFQDTLNAPGHQEDINRTASTAGLLDAIDAEVRAGHDIAFIGASNGGHVAVEMARVYGACWVILASSCPLLQQMSTCSTRTMPFVMTICDGERYFGGAD